VIQDGNAAGRLWTLLAQLRETVGIGGSAGSVVQAWAKVLGFDPKSDVERHMAIAGAYRILADVRIEIHSLNGRFNTERYNSYFAEWGNPFAIASRDSPHVTGESLASQGAMDVLASLADVLHGLGVRSGATTTAKLAAEELVSRVTSLIADVLAQDDLDADFRAFLLEHLREVEDALRRFCLRGYREIDEVIGKVHGDALRTPSRWAAFVHYPIWKEFAAVLGGLNLLRRGSGDVSEIAENAKALLELTGGGGPS